VTPFEFTIIIAAISVFAGLIGSLVGVGGGIVVVPALTLMMGLDIRHAVAASIVAVVATSSSAASAYVRERIANIRLGMLLETATVTGALCGAALGAFVSGRFLYALFGCVMTWTAINMLRNKTQASHELPPDPLGARLKLASSYYDKAEGREIAYTVSRTKLGLFVGWLAGVVSGLLGVGGGILKVPVMNLGMGVPIKAATATSNFMIGITAATGAAVYFLRGDVIPFVAAPVAVGIILGAKMGAKLLGGMQSRAIKMIFVCLLVVTAAQMLWRGFAG
jgi:uncharacterized membrane protein YfcA